MPPRGGAARRAVCGRVIAWTQLFGMISFELFGQFVGSFGRPTPCSGTRRSSSPHSWACTDAGTSLPQRKHEAGLGP